MSAIGIRAARVLLTVLLDSDKPNCVFVLRLSGGSNGNWLIIIRDCGCRRHVDDSIARNSMEKYNISPIRRYRDSDTQGCMRAGAPPKDPLLAHILIIKWGENGGLQILEWIGGRRRQPTEQFYGQK